MVDQIKTKIELEIIGTFENKVNSCDSIEELEKPTISTIQALVKLVLPYHRLTLVDKRTEAAKEAPSQTESKVTDLMKRLLATMKKRTTLITQEMDLLTEERTAAIEMMQRLKKVGKQDVL